ncbi:hypothetical protein GGU10DRAFT_249307, partial [Lentinula aff. detonsa]
SQAHLASKFDELEKKISAQLLRKGQKSDKECTNCARKGHVKEECYRKGGGKEGQYPSWWRGRKESTVPTNANLAVTDFSQPYALLANTTKAMGSIYADSAATDHFFRDRSDFITY